jgi:hypothetical protein
MAIQIISEMTPTVLTYTIGYLAILIIINALNPWITALGFMFHLSIILLLERLLVMKLAEGENSINF